MKMFKPPSAPTDSLYKFMALFGLGIMISTRVFQDNELGMLIAEGNKIQSHKRVIQAEMVEMVATTEVMCKISYGVPPKKKTGVPLSDASLDEILSDLMQLAHDARVPQGVQELATDAIPKVKKLILDRLNILDAVAAYDASIDRCKRSNMFLLVLGWSGTIIAIIGFRLWYFRLQVFLDEKIKSEAATSQKRR